MLVEIGLHLLEDSWTKVKACVWRSERRIHAGIPSSAHSTNIDRFRWVDKCRSDQCIIIKLPYLSWEKKHPCRIILCQDRMVWYNKRRTEFSVQEGGHWIDVAASWIVHMHPHCIIIAVEVEAFTAGLAAYMTILAHEINNILSTVAAVQMCMMIFMIICFSISDLNPNLLFLHLFTSVERF